MRSTFKVLFYVNGSKEKNGIVPIMGRVTINGSVANDGATASLNNLLKEEKYPDINYGIKLGYKNIGFNGKFYTFPYFLTFLLKRFVTRRG